MSFFNISTLYFLVTLTLLVYILFKKRNFDFFTVLVLSSFFYFSPLISGEINIPGLVYQQKISVYTYYFCISYFFMLALFVFIFDLFFSSYEVKEFIMPNEKTFSYLSKTSFILFFLGLLIVGIDNLLDPDKTKLATQNLALYGLGLWFVMSMFTLSYLIKNKYVFFICLACLLFSLYVGSRSYFAIAVLTLILVTFRYKNIKIYNHYLKFLFFIFFILFLVFFKVTYKSIKAFDFDAAYESLSSLDLPTISSIAFVDPNAVVYNLNYTIVNSISLSSDYIFHRIFSIFPVLGGLFQSIMFDEFPRYSTILADFHNLHFGLASSLHGEILAISGAAGFFSFIAIFFSIVFILNYNYMFKPSSTLLLSLPFIMYNLFYSFRVDLTFILGAVKTFVVLIIVFNIIDYFQKKLLRKKSV